MTKFYRFGWVKLVKSHNLPVINVAESWVMVGISSSLPVIFRAMKWNPKIKRFVSFRVNEDHEWRFLVATVFYLLYWYSSKAFLTFFLHLISLWELSSWSDFEKGPFRVCPFRCLYIPIVQRFLSKNQSFLELPMESLRGSSEDWKPEKRKTIVWNGCARNEKKKKRQRDLVMKNRIKQTKTNQPSKQSIVEDKWTGSHISL